MTVDLQRDLLGTVGISRMPIELRTRFGCAHRCDAFTASLEIATGVSRLF